MADFTTLHFLEDEENRVPEFIILYHIRFPFKLKILFDSLDVRISSNFPT